MGRKRHAGGANVSPGGSVSPLWLRGYMARVDKEAPPRVAEGPLGPHVAGVEAGVSVAVGPHSEVVSIEHRRALS